MCIVWVIQLLNQRICFHFREEESITFVCSSRYSLSFDSSLPCHIKSFQQSSVGKALSEGCVWFITTISLWYQKTCSLLQIKPNLFWTE